MRHRCRICKPLSTSLCRFFQLSVFVGFLKLRVVSPEALVGATVHAEGFCNGPSVPVVLPDYSLHVSQRGASERAYRACQGVAEG
jgi:hypothetical protein